MQFITTEYAMAVISQQIQQLNNNIQNLNLGPIFYQLYVCNGYTGANLDQIISSPTPIQYSSITSNMIQPIYQSGINIVTVPPYSFKISQSMHEFPTLVSFGFITDNNGNITGVINSGIRFNVFACQLQIQQLLLNDVIEVPILFDKTSSITHIQGTFNHQYVPPLSYTFNNVYVDFAFQNMYNTNNSVVAPIIFP